MDLGGLAGQRWIVLGFLEPLEVHLGLEAHYLLHLYFLGLQRLKRNQLGLEDREDPEFLVCQGDRPNREFLRN